MRRCGLEKTIGRLLHTNAIEPPSTGGFTIKLGTFLPYFSYPKYFEGICYLCYHAAMHADIDMSGRIEETNRATAVGLANGVSFCVYLSGAEKRKVIAILKQRYPDRNITLIHVFIFTVLLYYVLQPRIEDLSLVTIDLEYMGHDALIKNRVLTLLRNAGLRVEKEQLSIAQVGKKSPSHELAYGVYAGKKKPDRILTAADVLVLIRGK